ncbi:hypothetical protein ACFL2B_00185 [Patescibacteria group bacterium]
MDFADIYVEGDPSVVKKMLEAYYIQEGYTVTWHSEYYAVAWKGDSVTSFVAGIAAQEHKISLSIFQDEQKGLVVRLEKIIKGFLGAMVRMAVINSEFKRNWVSLCKYYQDNNMYRGCYPEVK